MPKVWWTILKERNAQIFECKLELEIMVLCRISLSILVKVPKTVRPHPVWIPHPRRVDMGVAPKMKSTRNLG